MEDARPLMSNLPDGLIQRSQITPEMGRLFSIFNGFLIEPSIPWFVGPIVHQVYPEWFANFLLSIPVFGSVVSLFGDIRKNSNNFTIPL